MSAPEFLSDALADGWGDDFETDAERDPRLATNLSRPAMVAGEIPARDQLTPVETAGSLKPAKPCVEFPSSRMRSMYRELGPLASGVHVTKRDRAAVTAGPVTHRS